MATITAGMVAELREKTGAGMMQCKKALTETDGNMEEAVVVLRKTLGNKVAGREGRTAAEGLVLARVSEDKTVASIIELNSETDFVARNEDFKTLGKAIATQGLTSSATTLEELLADSYGAGTVADGVTEVGGRIGEKIALGRFAKFVSTDGAVAAYVHNPGGSGDEGGKVGAIVEVTGSGDKDALSNLAREIALHITSAKPKFLSDAEVGEAVLEQERDIARAQAANDPKMAGKPASVIESMVGGRVRKFLEEVVLLNQKYVRDDKKTIAALVKETPGATVARFVRFTVGETAAAQTEEASA